MKAPATVAGAAHRLRPADLGTLEELLYEGVGSYAEPHDHARRVMWIAAAAEHHISTSEVFARLAHGQGFSVQELRATGELASVPLVSSGLFKHRDVRSGTHGAVRLSRSSGTQGTESIVPRDDPTLERLTGTVLHGLREFLGHTAARETFVLSPPAAEAQDVWFSYVLTLVELLYDTRFFVHTGALHCDELYGALATLDREVEPAIVAPPGLLVDFLRWMVGHDLRLQLGARSGFVVTAGGWKRREDEAVDRAELIALAGDRLGIAATQLRDAFNMVELNTVLFECEHARKHIPPWLAIHARRPADMAIAASGEEGLLSFLDPTATSYPAFILSDDFGRVHAERCPCGRHGETVQLTRRLATVEQRGCGLKLNRFAP